MVKTKYGIAPACIDGKRHQWKKGSQFRDTGVCARCGFDLFEKQYRLIN